MPTRRPLVVLAALTAVHCGVALAACDPVLQWEWDGLSQAESPYYETCVTPLVLQLTDDNGDGRIDARDGPDIVFNSCSPGITHVCQLIALDGETGREHFQILLPGSHGSGMVGADIDLDGLVEIVTFDDRRIRLLAREHDGTQKWIRPFGTAPTTSTDAFGSADFDQDGRPEIFVGASVFDADGNLLWSGGAGTGQDARFRTHVTHAVDLDPDSPGLELLAGASLYDARGAVLWDATAELGDGWTAVADFDGDGDPEIVLTSGGRVTLLDHRGARLGPDHVLADALSQPLVADLDGDGEPEVLVTDGAQLQALDWTGAAFSVRWSEAVSDASRQNGATAFDFDGDGAAEVVYHDEDAWYLFGGDSGALIAGIPFDSATGIETPVVANIDRDSAPEIVVAGCIGGFAGEAAVRAYECACGVPARAIWNQFGSHGTQVEDDGSVPRVEAPPWQASNTWMAQLPEAAGAAPGPVADAGEDRTICAGETVLLDGTGSRACSSLAMDVRWLVGGVPSCEGELTCPVSPSETTTVTLELSCEGHAGSCAASDTVTVVVVPDPPPGPVNGSLMLSRAGTDSIDFTWSDLLSPVDGYEVVTLPSAAGPPAAPAMDAAPVAGTAPSGTPPLTISGALGEPADWLVFWKVRGLSPCTRSVGPTCNGFPAQPPCP